MKTEYTTNWKDEMIAVLDERDKLKAVNVELVQSLRSIMQIVSPNSATLPFLDKARYAIAKAEAL